MTKINLHDTCITYLKSFCEDIPERCVGSEGNRTATRYFRDIIASFGWGSESQDFDAIDWRDDGASLTTEGIRFDVLVSPYSLGYTGEARLVSASNIEQLAQLDARGKILLLHGDIAKEQLMPKNFVFFNPEEHQRIVALLESVEPDAIVCSTDRNPALAGGVYPFPLIEDGDFNIPSVYMTEEEGAKLLPFVDKNVQLASLSKRIPGKGYNVIGRKGESSAERIVITAHIDAKKGTPGAIDNATGVTVLLLLAQLLEDYAGKRQIELTAFNGEDYYAAPGQMLYVANNEGHFDEIQMNINIDGAGHKDGKSAFSFFDLPGEIEYAVKGVLDSFPGITEGAQWYQGDHSIFVQQGRPAIAITSEWFLKNMANQDVTHTPKDNLEIVDSQKVVEIAEALNQIVRL